MLDKDGIESVIKTVSNKYNKNISISDGYKLKVVMTIKGDKTSEDITDIMYVYKIDDKWFYMAISPQYKYNFQNTNDISVINMQ